MVKVQGGRDFHHLVAYTTPDTEWILSIHAAKANLLPSKVEAKLYRAHRPNGRYLQQTLEQRREVSPPLPPGTIPFFWGVGGSSTYYLSYYQGSLMLRPNKVLLFPGVVRSTQHPLLNILYRFSLTSFVTAHNSV